MINLTDLFKNLTEDQDNLCGDCDDFDCKLNPNYKSNKINKILGGISMKTLKTNQVTEAMLRVPGTLFHVDGSKNLKEGYRLSFGDYAVMIDEYYVPEGKWSKKLGAIARAGVVDKVIISDDSSEYKILVSELISREIDIDDIDEAFASYLFTIQDDVPVDDAMGAARKGAKIHVELDGLKASFADFYGKPLNIVDGTAPTTKMLHVGKWFID